jgi:hypothetical protein
MSQQETEYSGDLQANIARILADALMVYTADIEAPGDVSQAASSGRLPPPTDSGASNAAGLPMALHQLLVQHVLPLLPAMMDSGSMPLYAQKIMASLLSRCTPLLWPHGAGADDGTWLFQSCLMALCHC